MTKIGEKTVVHSETLIVRDEESADLTILVEGWPLKFVLSFHPEGAAEQTVNWSVENDALRLRLNRWTNSLGTSLSEPAAIAKSPTGKTIELLLYQHHIGNLNRVDLQFTVRDQQ